MVDRTAGGGGIKPGGSNAQIWVKAAIECLISESGGRETERGKQAAKSRRALVLGGTMEAGGVLSVCLDQPFANQPRENCALSRASVLSLPPSRVKQERLHGPDWTELAQGLPVPKQAC